MPLPAHLRKRRPRDPFAGQQLAVRVRRDNQPPPAPPRLTLHRIRLLQAIRDKEITLGRGSFTGQYRWAGATVTRSVQPFVACGWAHEIGAHLELTDAGIEGLDTGGTP